MELTSTEADDKYAAIVTALPSAVVAFDFDGTLSPIVDDPTQALIHPEAGDALVALADKVKAVAVVTGRPARQVLDLGGLESVADEMAARGKVLHLFGQYGNERWSSNQRIIHGARPPAGLAAFERDLPSVLRAAGAAGAYIEDKGLAVAVHTRRLPDADATFDRLRPALGRLAERHGLDLEPGRQVIEVRAAGMDKGIAVDKLVNELDAGGVVFVGDDLGDIDAFESVMAWGRRGLPTLLVCSASSEESALLPLSDLVVHGPDGVVELVRKLTADANGG